MTPLITGLLLTLMTARAQEVPEGLEAGSTAREITVSEGQTVDTIAMEWAVLPDEIRSWNGLGPSDTVAVGDQLVVWVAPGVQEAEDRSEEAPAEAAADAEERVRDDAMLGFVGVQIGPTVPLSPLGVGPAPRLEVGVALPFWDQRIRLFAAGTYARPVAQGGGKDARLPGAGSWSYTLRQQEWTVALGPLLHLPEVLGPVDLEVALAPEVYWLQSTVDGDAGSSSFGTTREQYSRLGFYAAAGGALGLGPGEAMLHLSFASSGLNGVVTGTASTARVTPMGGYRLVF